MKFKDFYSTPEVKDIMIAYINKFPQMFDGFDVDRIDFVITRKKKTKMPIKIHSVGYPANVFGSGKPYIVEIFDQWWVDMDQRCKNLAVFHIMCAIPTNGMGFDEDSDKYAKKTSPEISMYMLEFAACGGVPNWMENPNAIDPMERVVDEIAGDVAALDNQGDGIVRIPAVDMANV